ncbi:reverse transcriptase [Gossypium australe]|uniref:Reverse transcriptase n=1 Tax=Gossypium australe TaxID=47621 RepID=A0A5B6WZ11_9ROSI|nr:reverse transcriptase [Gossypium australe]
MVSQYRLISLCNNIYKIVTRLLVLRLTPLFNKLISPIQDSFIKGHQTTDNVIIFQEMVHSFRKLKGKTSSMIIKLDMKKKPMIDLILYYFNFPKKWIDLIHNCITTSTMSILLNGGRLENFRPSRGICQSDPLLRYIFILCMEYLNLQINIVVENRH